MIEDVLEPLEEYKNNFKTRFREVCEETFAELSKEANVDIELNRKTCRNIYSTEEVLSKLKKKLYWTTFGCWILWIAVAVLGIYVYSTWSTASLWLNILLILIAVVLVVLFFLKIYPALKKLKAEKGDAESLINKLKEQAWNQMQSLNQLYDWNIFARMATRTVPRLQFDPYFTSQRLADLKTVYGWDDSFNKERSVIYSHSGLINGNPFVLCRTRKMEWGEKTYYGSLEIRWTTIERDSDGKTYTREHFETLHAEYTAPFPEYYELTRLIYGNEAAPDLIFNREQSGLAGKEGSLKFKWKNRQLKKKSEDLKNSDYAMMTNSEFEVAFDTHDRNNNQQFALLFTPLAQQSMMALLSDKEVGYGDDFDFHKYKKINTIISNHMQELDLDVAPEKFYNFDYDKAANTFRETYSKYFHAFYFSFAPLLCVPMYQQIRPESAIYGRNMKPQSSFWEHESLANYWGEEKFKHPDCVTNCILKTESKEMEDGYSKVIVTAYGYRTIKRTAYVEKYGGDGQWHSVPVDWDEYLPIEGTGSILIKEDNEIEAENATFTSRHNHAIDMLNKTQLTNYRRNIASKLIE